MELIDKAKLLAEINRRILEDYNTGDKEKDAVAQGAIASLKYYIEDTLEVKDVDTIEREVKVDAGGYPFIEATELYDYDNDKPLAKAGDKIKVVFIKDK